MAIRSARERLLQAAAFELGGLAMVAPVYAMVMGAGALDSIALVVAVAVTAALVSPLHNHLFDLVEWRLTRRLASDRPAGMRLVHAVSHEGSSTLVTLPVIMVMGGHGFWEALAIDVAMTVFYAVYLYAFHILWDRWRPVRVAAPALPVRVEAQPVAERSRPPVE